MQALKRLNIPEIFLNVIQDIYTEPQFKVCSNKFESEYLTQRTGIRQGCPLSPYLFTLVMTVMFHDIKARLNTPKQQEPIRGIQFAELLYADDTFLFGTYTPNINKFLAEIQQESAYYNLRLNMNKCINI